MLLATLLAAGVLTGAPEAAPSLFGKPLRDLAPAKLEDVLERPESFASVRLEGTVEKVCRNKGCWMTLRQGDRRVHVTFEGYSFFLPKDAAAKKATLEGRVVVKPADPSEVAHLRSEGAGDAAAERVSVEAYGVELR